MRLLICYYCRTLDELPDFNGPPEKDEILQSFVQFHNDAGTGEHLIGDKFRVFVLNNERGDPVSVEHWRANKEEIIKRFNDGLKGKTGLDDWFYDDRSTYAQDALRCFSQHHRPEAECIDWWDDSKRIGRPTELGRAKLKEAPGMGHTDPHLCQWCPVASYVRTQVNFKRGLYK